MNLARLPLAVFLPFALSLPVAGCDKSTKDEPAVKDEPAPHAAAHEPETHPAPAATPAATHAEAAEAPNPFPPVDEYGRAVDGLPSVIPPPGSRVPTVEEWNAVPKEITVRGSSALGCETKMLREWLRVSCRGSANGTPNTVTTKSSGGQQAFVGTFGDRTSAVVQVVRGKEYAAEYTWLERDQTTSSSTLHVSWSSDQPRPSLFFAE